LDVHKATVCVAVAESGRGGEVRQIGVFENRPQILCKMAARLGKGGRRLSFCYEAGRLFSYIDLEKRIREDHLLRLIRAIANAALKSLSGEFDKL
jgi:hypothetical protein